MLCHKVHIVPQSVLQFSYRARVCVYVCLAVGLPFTSYCFASVTRLALNMFQGTIGSSSVNKKKADKKKNVNRNEFYGLFITLLQVHNFFSLRCDPIRFIISGCGILLSISFWLHCQYHKLFLGLAFCLFSPSIHIVVFHAMKLSKSYGLCWMHENGHSSCWFHRFTDGIYCKRAYNSIQNHHQSTKS